MRIAVSASRISTSGAFGPSGQIAEGQARRVQHADFGHADLWVLESGPQLAAVGSTWAIRGSLRQSADARLRVDLTHSLRRPGTTGIVRSA
jgi:hypothetical protein